MTASIRAGERRIGAVVLGAGAASRMGLSKLTLPFGGSTVIGTVVARLGGSDIDDMVIVTGHHAEDVESAVGDLIETVRNPDPDRGNLSSLLCGVDALGDSFDGFLVVVGDMPAINPTDVNALTDLFGTKAVDAVVSAYTDGWGHPLVVSRDLILRLDQSASKPLWEGVRGLSDDMRAELVVARPKPHDINTPQDHRSALEMESTDNRV